MTNLALQLMNDALENVGQYEVEQDNDLNRRDIQVYALASIAESLARIADAVSTDNGRPALRVCGLIHTREEAM